MNIKKKPLIIASIIAIIFIAYILHHHKTPKTPAIPAVSVRVEKPIQQSITQTTTTTGTLIADKSTTITPRASGYITAISFQEGQTVKAGEVLFQLDSQTQQNALAAAQASFALSKLQYDRDAQFLKKGFITQDMYYSAKVALKQNQAKLQEAQTDLADRTITAPFDGTVGGQSVSLGGFVNPGNTLTTLVDNNHLRAEYALPVKNLNQIQLNQPVIIFDSAKKNKITATVSYVAPSIDTATQTISVHANLDNTAHIFKPGEFVTITQTIGTQQQTLLVPEQSILASINGYHVFVVKNNKAIKTLVKIGDHINGNVIITSGLSPADQVIIAGENQVKDGMSVHL